MTYSKTRFIPDLERLEDRINPTPYHVTMGANVSNQDVTDQSANSGTLRYVIDRLNASGQLDANTIDFGGTVGAQIGLDTALAAINKPVTITGPGRDALTVTRNNVQDWFRIFEISAGVEVTIRLITISNGRGVTGAGILNEGILTIENARIRDCNAVNSDGGAIASAATLTIKDSIITANLADRNGGGIYISAGSARIEGTQITSNNALWGGALSIAGGTVNIFSTQINGNNNAWYGGGVYIKGGTLTISNQSVVGPNTATYGGAGLMILKGAAAVPFVTIDTGSRINNNTVAAAQGIVPCFGGGIENDGGNLTLGGDVQVSGNTADWGGGIYNERGTVTNINPIGVTIGGNTARVNGGGIYNYCGTVDLANATINGNAATTGSGGGVYTSGTAMQPANVTITNGTLNGNTARVVGGAMAVKDGNGSVVLRNDTIAQNTVTDGNGGGLGGGICAENGGVPSLVNSIVAGNTDDSGSPDISGVVSSLGHNLIGDTTGSSGWVGSDILNDDPILSELDYHGGPTMTMLLLADSPALDAGDDAAAATLIVDQRGFPRNVGDHVDIGAVEMQSGEEEAESPYAYDVEFSVSFEGVLNVPTLEGGSTMLDYSGNSGNLEVTIVEVEGDDANVGVEIATGQGGTVTLNSDGTFVYAAPANFFGDDSFTYTAGDGENTASGTVTIHIGDTAAYDARYSTLKNQTLTVTADPDGLLHYASAASGDPITVTKVNGSSGNVGNGAYTAHGGTVTVESDGSFVYEPDTDFTGDDTFDYTISDGTSESTATVTIHVAQVLAAGGIQFETQHDEELTVPNMLFMYNLLDFCADADEDPLTVVAVNGDTGLLSSAATTANGGTVTVESDGSFVYTPPAHWAGMDWFSYTVSDGSQTSTGYVFINVTNNAPYVSNAAYDTLHDQTLTVSAEIDGLLSYAGDTDEDDVANLAVVAVNGDDQAIDSPTATTEGGSVTVSADGTFEYTPPEHWTGDDTFWVTVSDGVWTATALVTIHVTNNEPTVSNPEFYTMQDQMLTASSQNDGLLSTANASDTDMDDLYVVAINADTGGIDTPKATAHGGSVTVSADGTFVYTPPSSWTGDDTFTFDVWDGAATVRRTATIHVT